MLRLYSVNVSYRAVCVSAVVVTCLYNLDVSLCHARLLSELLLEEVERDVQVAVEQIADKAQSEHVTALQHRLNVHSRVLQAVLDHSGDRACDYSVCINIHFCQWVIGLELSLLKVFLLETVSVYDYSSAWLCVAILCLESRCIHCNKHVAFVAWSIYLASADVHLETRDACERTLWSTYVGWIVWECAYAVSHCCRNCREDVTSQLHSIAGVTGETHCNLV